MNTEIKYILFDVAGTLLYKPAFYTTLAKILNQHGFQVSMPDLMLKHKIVSELVQFPDSTSKEFYSTFNSNLLFALGIIPTEKLLEEIFSQCSYLPWEKFEDTNVLANVNLPIGILSNFNKSLKTKLEDFFGNIFSDIFVSEEVGVAKPETRFFQKAIDKIAFPPESILYIGDSLRLDIKPALETGMKPLLIDRNNYFPNSEYGVKDLNQIFNYIS